MLPITSTDNLSSSIVTQQPYADISNEQIANKLTSVLNRTWQIKNTKGNFSESVLLDEKYLVAMDSWSTYEKCSLCKFGVGHKMKATVTNLKNGQSFVFSPITIHTIREHTNFPKLDRAKVCEILELESGKDYTPKTFQSYYFVWNKFIGSQSCNDPISRFEDIRDHKSAWEKILDMQLVSSQTIAYLVEDLTAPEFLYRGIPCRAKMYIHNLTGEELPPDAFIFNIFMDTLYRCSGKICMIEHEIKPITKQVLGPEDRTLKAIVKG